MQSHDDADAPPFLQQLEARAKKLTAEAANQITAGRPGEPVIAEATAGRFLVRQMPDDPACLRVSIGSIATDDEPAYLVFRGERTRVRKLLSDALDAMRETEPYR